MQRALLWGVSLSLMHRMQSWDECGTLNEWSSRTNIRIVRLVKTTESCCSLFHLSKKFIKCKISGDIWTFGFQAIKTALKNKEHTKALVLALRLNESRYIRECIESVPSSDLPLVSSQIPAVHLSRLLENIAQLLENSPHLEFMLRWCQVSFSFVYAYFTSKVCIV